MLVAISFGRVVWMLEKAGIDPIVAIRKREPAMSCAYNIARWWLVEHRHRHKKDTDISFPGETFMPQGMVPAALWVSMRDYDGVWERGRFPGDYDKFEHFGFLGDQKTAAIFDALQIYGVGTSPGPTWRPIWYRNQFVDWARSTLLLASAPDIWKHSPKDRVNWCGMTGCQYPYVSEPEPPVPGLILPKNVTLLRKEDLRPMPFSDEFLIPQWGAHLRKTSDCEKGGEQATSDCEEDSQSDEE